MNWVSLVLRPEAVSISVGDALSNLYG